MRSWDEFTDTSSIHPRNAYMSSFSVLSCTGKHPELMRQLWGIQRSCNLFQRVSDVPWRFYVTFPSEHDAFKSKVYLDITKLVQPRVLYAVYSFIQFGAAHFLASESTSTIWSVFYQLWTQSSVLHWSSQHDRMCPRLRVHQRKVGNTADITRRKAARVNGWVVQRPWRGRTLPFVHVPNFLEIEGRLISHPGLVYSRSLCERRNQYRWSLTPVLHLARILRDSSSSPLPAESSQQPLTHKSSMLSKDGDGKTYFLGTTRDRFISTGPSCRRREHLNWQRGPLVSTKASWAVNRSVRRNAKAWSSAADLQWWPDHDRIIRLRRTIPHTTTFVGKRRFVLRLGHSVRRQYALCSVCSTNAPRAVVASSTWWAPWPTPQWSSWG